MDIIDVILGGGFSPKGRISTYAALAQKAVADANTAVNNIDSITEQTTANSEAAAQALEDANAALEAVTTALADLEEAGLDVEAVHDEIDKLTLSISTAITSSAISKSLEIEYPSEETDTLANLLIMYQQEGDNTNGTMTQKAIKQYVNSVKSELQTAINNINISGGESGGSTNLGTENAGNVVVIGPDGNIVAGSTTEDSIIEALVKAGAYSVKNAVGMELDYENKSYTRTQEAKTYNAGTSYNKYPMYGGRIRCNVADDGSITAWYGDNNYRDDGSNGQVMVYQPKFYYQRIPINLANLPLGKIVRKESLILTSVPTTGFKVHPLFINEEGEEVDYALLPAYDGSIYDTSAEEYYTDDRSGVTFGEDKLSSIAGVKPASGKYNALTVTNAETLAKNRGPGWHTMNMRAESANQMLFMTEFGSPNSQVSLELGICQIPNNMNYNCSCITGSTASLGNRTGYADETVAEVNGSFVTYNTNGRRAVSYRGMENPWGNIWHYIGDTILYGNGAKYGGEAYICTDYNYTPTQLGENYESVGFILPNAESFISAFGYGDSKYDWVYLPAECASSANNLLPIGDCAWTSPNLDGLHVLIAGGTWHFEEKNGLFCVGGDYVPTTYARSYGAKLIHVPIKNANYTANVASWTAKMGG